MVIMVVLRSVLRSILHKMGLEARHSANPSQFTFGEPVLTIGPWAVHRQNSGRLWFNSSEFDGDFEFECSVLIGSGGAGGSSAIVDYLREFRGVALAVNSEFRLIKDYGGLLDLSDFWRGRQLQNSWKMIEDYTDLFEQQFRRPALPYLGRATPLGLGDGRNQKKCLENFLTDISLTSFKGYWIVDRRPSLAYSVGKAFQLARGGQEVRLLDATCHFDEAALRHIEQLRLSLVPDPNYSHIIYDQALGIGDFTTASRWFRSPKIIWTYRDPRDQYLSWKRRFMGLFPLDPEVFIRLYRDEMKRLSELELEHLAVRYEDFVLNHDQVSEQIREFLGLNKNLQVIRGTHFDPSQSAQRIGKWRAQKSPEIELVSKELSDYLYST